MTEIIEGRHWCEGIVSEEDGHYSRDEIKIGASQTVVPGTVLSKVTATGVFVALNPAGNDGSETACAIALYPAKTGSGGSAKIAALTRHAEFRDEALTWPSGITAPQKATAKASLEKIGIVIRA
jgi:hypothetical protein